MVTAKAIAEPELESLERKTPVIDPNRIEMNADGFKWREFMVRLPDGFVADDLKDPAAWRKVQAGRNALRKFDRLMILAYDETWFAEAVVASADYKSAVLAKPRLTTMPARYDNLFEDDKYRVAFIGHGYVVERKADGHRMTQPVANAELAARELAALYPRRAAA